MQSHLCINKLLSEIKRKANEGKYLSTQPQIRLSDLLVRLLLFMIYRKGEGKYQTAFTEVIQISSASINQTLKNRAELWNKAWL